MATTAMSIVSERWLDEVLLRANVVDVAGAGINEAFTLPLDLGDCAILSILAQVSSIATTPGEGFTARGGRALIRSSDGASIVDYVGASEWLATDGVLAAYTRVETFIDPDALCLWRQGEQLIFVSTEIDVNAAPTGDLQVLAKVARIRPVVGQEARRPIKLVR